MKLKPFADLIKLSKEKLDEAMAPIRARQVQAKAELELAKLDSDLLTKEATLQEKCAERDINLPGIMDLLDQIAILERRKKQYAKVLGELFPDRK
jgi:hypothetical protein